MTIHLELDSDGNLWLIEQSEIAVVDTLLGAISDPATSYRVPGELLGRLGELEREWADAVEFAAAIRAEANETYRRTR